MQEEVEHKTVNLAVRSSKVTAQVLYKGLKAFINHQKQKAAKKAVTKDEPVKGEQSGKELIGQGQGVSSMPIDDGGVKDFKKICRIKLSAGFYNFSPVEVAPVKAMN